MNSTNVICPHCDHEFIIEDYRLNDDELTCPKCKELVAEE